MSIEAIWDEIEELENKLWKMNEDKEELESTIANLNSKAIIAKIEEEINFLDVDIEQVSEEIREDKEILREQGYEYHD